MRVLVIGEDPQRRSLVRSLIAGPQWRITRCASATEAARVLRRARRPFDYILVEPDQEPDVEETLRGARAAEPSPPPVVYLERCGREPEPGEGFYGLYPLSDTAVAAESEAGAWVLEFHAPCAGRRY